MSESSDGMRGHGFQESGSQNSNGGFDVETDFSSMYYSRPNVQQPLSTSRSLADESLGHSQYGVNVRSNNELCNTQPLLPQDGVPGQTWRILEQHYGAATYKQNYSQCMLSFKYATSFLTREEMLSYASQLIYFHGIDALKCSKCKQTHALGTDFKHAETCEVERCLQERQGSSGIAVQEQVESNVVNSNPHVQIQNLPQTSRNSPARYQARLQIHRERRPVNGVGGEDLPAEASGLEITEVKAAYRQFNSSHQDQWDQRPRFPPNLTTSATRGQAKPQVEGERRPEDGATGGIAQKEILIKAAGMPCAQPPISRANGNLQQSNGQIQAIEAAVGTRQSYPAPVAGVRTKSNITVVKKCPKYPEYASIHSRVNSYLGWNGSLKQSPQQLSEAGFFFVGEEDFTRCFYCGGGLKKWEQGDVPVLEHIQWFPDCEYIRKLIVATSQDQIQEHVPEEQRRCSVLPQRHDGASNSTGNGNSLRFSNKTPPEMHGPCSASSIPFVTAQTGDSLSTSDVQDTDHTKMLLNMGFQEDQIKKAISVDVGKKLSVNELVDIILKQEDAHQNALMDPSICGGCHRRKIGCSQYECRHIVCFDCAPAVGGLCKICGSKVVKVFAYDSSNLK